MVDRESISGDRIRRPGVRFDCPECGKLLRDDAEHAEQLDGAYPTCGKDLRIVGVGDFIVERARWYRCLDCQGLFMRRRGEIVETKPKTGFKEFA